ncbi:NADH-quinone oxidoreductase subunit N [Chloroflexi bacterium TSY]|nr:NADH-quinone oxidoreductase subunit N [Chloroflexi bacterium TSY]
MTIPSVDSIGSLIPEIILLIGGLLVLLLDMMQNSATYEKESGRGFMAISVFFLFVGLVAVFVQSLLFDNPTSSQIAGNPEGMSIHIAQDVVIIDPFGSFFKVVIYTGMLLVAVAGGGFMNKHAPKSGRAEFWSLFMFVTLAMSLAVSANNLILLFLSFEFLSITSYILAGFMREDQRSSEAGLKYFLYGSIASSVMLYGMSLLYGASGSLNLHEIAQIIVSDEGLSIVALPAILLTLVGFGFKMSLVPFFQWAPDTYDGAPTPITAYLSTASKAVGFAVTARVFLVSFGGFRAEWIPILSGLAILTMTVGNLMALRQNSVKRMLAYSSVAQAGYILMGLVAIVTANQADLSTLSMNGLNGVLIYIAAYLFTNVGAFLVVMVIEDTIGSHDISAYQGLMYKAPGLAIAMLIFLLSLTGIPVTGGFIGKFYVFGAAVQRQFWYLAIAGFINAGIAAGYYLRIVGAMFFAKQEDIERTTGTQPLNIGMAVQLVLAICVLVTIWIGVYPPNFINMVRDASEQLLAFGL